MVNYWFSWVFESETSQNSLVPIILRGGWILPPIFWYKIWSFWSLSDGLKSGGLLIFMCLRVGNKSDGVEAPPHHSTLVTKSPVVKSSSAPVFHSRSQPLTDPMDLCIYLSILLFVDVEKNPRVGWKICSARLRLVFKNKQFRKQKRVWGSRQFRGSGGLSRAG